MEALRTEKPLGALVVDSLWSLAKKAPPITVWRLAHTPFILEAQKLLGEALKKLGDAERDTGTAARVLGVELTSPIGIGAGVDKDGSFTWLAEVLGAGFHVVGSILPYPYPGVEPKLLLRLPSGASINRLGLPSPGLKRVVKNLSKKPRSVPLAVSIAGHSVKDYLTVYSALRDYADWFEVNISCPNVESSKSFEDANETLKLCRFLSSLKKKPLLLKIPPPKSRFMLEKYVETAKACRLDGIVVSNTLRVNMGGYNAGLGGAPLYNLVVKAVKMAREMLPSRMIVVGVGGIDSPKKAVSILRAGANLVEIVTGIFSSRPSIIWEAGRAALAATSLSKRRRERLL